MVPHLDKERAIYYKNTAERMLHALITKCGNTDLDRSNGLLLHRTYARHRNIIHVVIGVWMSVTFGEITFIWKH